MDYVLVIFGGVTGYSSDDINKFLWPVRIGSGVFPDDMHHEKVRTTYLYIYSHGRDQQYELFSKILCDLLLSRSVGLETINTVKILVGSGLSLFLFADGMHHEAIAGLGLAIYDYVEDTYT